MYPPDRISGANVGVEEAAPPLKYLRYVVGVLLVLFVAVGMGAVAALVVGGAATDSSKTDTFGDGASETTSSARALEETTTGRSENGDDTIAEVSFEHRATEENSRGDYTYISDPSANGNPNAVVLVSDEKGVGTSTYKHNIGVWYESGAQEWAIFNQDLAAVPRGATFEVEIPPASATFVHEAGPLNTAGNYTYLDNELTNGEPDAVISVTQNWNPGGGRGIYNDHPVGAVYDAKLKKWAVFNRDGAPMPKGASFNIAVPAEAS
jgi:hypothetical protein